MYEKQKKNVKMAANQIVENLNDIAKPVKEGKGKGYLARAKGTVKMPETDSDVKIGLEKFIDKQVKEVKGSSKKIKVEVE